ncbi:PTS sugar transporter subunit IIA [Enemella sp. A6]|uniref:PTS sugar transporter subunit IIA n=1 Tax=Enemella sp. A6 TaxID=3440152 RepID=UPI003EB8CC39
MTLAPLDGLCLDGLKASSWSEVLDTLGREAVRLGYATEAFPKALADRESKFPTGLPTKVPVAIPHADPEHALITGLGVARLAEPVEFGEMGGSGNTVAVQLVVMLLVQSADGHMDALTSVLAAVQDEEAMNRLLEAHGGEDLQRRATAVFSAES